MKVILSRKGFDSQYGGMPSPILPDGTLLSLPIPSKEDTTKYTDLTWNGKSYYELIQELKPSSQIKANYTCHLDPDIRKAAADRLDGWKLTFGQTGFPLGHLQKQKVGIWGLVSVFWLFPPNRVYRRKIKLCKRCICLARHLRIFTGRGYCLFTGQCTSLVDRTSTCQDRTVETTQCNFYRLRFTVALPRTARSGMSFLC